MDSSNPLQIQWDPRAHPILCFIAICFALWMSGIMRPEVHTGTWHTCNDPNLKGKFHWSCCDNLVYESHCTRFSQHRAQWWVNLKRRTVGLAPPPTAPAKASNKKTK